MTRNHNRNRKNPARTRPTLRRTAALLSAALMLAPASAALAQNVSPLAVADAISDEFMLDRAVPAEAIRIGVTDGIATLSGTVGDILAKERAAAIARTVRGVEAVVNEITVDPPGDLSDAQIAREVNAALLTDAATDAFDIDVSVEEGVVTLTGTVDSWQQRRLAGRVAKSVRGVTALVNNLDLNFDTTRNDEQIEAEIESTFAWDTLIDGALIGVGVDDGVVTLSGTVGSAAEKDRAITKAYVNGVANVEAEELEVARWARDEDLRTDKYTYKPDREIEQVVEKALLMDSRLRGFDLNAEVEDGTVTLRGTVDNLAAKRAAERDARNTVGVVRVINRIRVEGPGEMTDAAIADDVLEALGRNAVTEAFEIAVAVDNGVVTLDGEVDSYLERSTADEVASRVAGVVSVDNRLEVDRYDADAIVTYDPYVYDVSPYEYPWYQYDPAYNFRSDTEIAENIRDELWWSPFIDSDDVNVEVDDGEAVLTGTVESWSEYRAATENAWEGGATFVDNDLVVSAD